MGVMRVRRDLTLATGSLLFLSLPVLAWWWGGSLSRTGVPLTLSVILLVLVAGVAYRDYAAGTFDLFQPVLWKGLLFFIPSFVLKTWHILWLGPDPAWLRKFNDWDGAFNLSLATGVLSYLCLALGYYVFPFRRRSRQFLASFKSRALNAWVLKWPLFVLFVTGVAASFYLLRTGGLGYTDFRESGAFTHVIQHISKYNLYALFIFLWALMVSRSYGEPSWVTLLVVMACCPILLVVGVIFVTPFREVKMRHIGFDRPAGMREAMAIYRDIAADRAREGPGQSLKCFLELITGRANNMESLAIVLERADQVQHLERAYGIANNMWDDFLWGLVPRFLYPQKPNTSLFSVKFGHIYHDLPPNMSSMSNPTIMGDLYRNLGYAGILVGMMVLGIFLRWLYIVLVEDNRNPLLFAVYFFTIMGMNFEGTYIGLYHALVRLWVMLGLFSALLIWLYRHQAPAVIRRLPKPGARRTQVVCPRGRS